MKNLREIIEEIIPEVAADGMLYFQKAIADKKIIFSEELLRDFSLHITNEAESVSASISFQAYGRFKDMKYVNYHRTLNLSALEKWVEEIGVSKFAWIPGYEGSGHVPTDSIAIRRLARAISHSIVSVGVVKRKTAGTWYNETKMRMMNVARRRILEKATQLVADNVVEVLEAP